jgi:hypothetical protein
VEQNVNGNKIEKLVQTGEKKILWNVNRDNGSILCRTYNFININNNKMNTRDMYWKNLALTCLENAIIELS